LKADPVVGFDVRGKGGVGPEGVAADRGFDVNPVFRSTAP
jgi:hypothetical protein